MRGVNKVILIGNIGKDPETRAFASGDKVTNATLATSESWKDKQTGEQKESTEWHNLVFIGRLADIAERYVKKGSKIYVEGSIKTRKWQDKEGQDRYTTEVRVRELQLLDSKPADGGEQGRSSAPSRGAPARTPVPAAKQHHPAEFVDDDLDSIPF